MPSWYGERRVARGTASFSRWVPRRQRWRECLAIEVDTSLPAARVADALDRIAAARGLQASISVDHGPEFAGRTLDGWAHARGVVLDFIPPGKPVDNAYVESFNGKLRDECRCLL